jgi:hypothetical protein
MRENTQQIEDPVSAVKRELDRLELIERVPALQRRAARIGLRTLDARGYPMPVLTLPRHPAVMAYINECAALVRTDADLRTARRNLIAAQINYKDRVLYRSRRDICLDADGRYIKFERFVSLSAIIEARVDAMHWRKVINKLEAEKKIKEQQEQNRRHIARHRLSSIGLAC